MTAAQTVFLGTSPTQDPPSTWVTVQRNPSPPSRDTPVRVMHSRPSKPRGPQHRLLPVCLLPASPLPLPAGGPSPVRQRKQR